MRNASGRYVQADLTSLPAAAATFRPSQPGELRSFLTNAPGTQAYPIAAFTYFLVPEKLADSTKAKNMTEFLRWILTSGQKQSASLGYAALPDAVAKDALESFGRLQ